MESREPFQTGHGRAADIARDLLRRAIVRGDFPPGAVLSQGEVEVLLGVGRTPLREAIKVVREEGLLVSEPNQKVRVAGFSVDDLDQVYALRIVVDATAVRSTVSNLTPDDKADLHALVAKMDHFAVERDFERFEGPHREFHGLLVKGQGLRTLALSEQLFYHAERYRRAYEMSGPDAYPVAHGEHRRILEAALALDADRVARELTAHYARTAAGVIRQMNGGHELPRVMRACAIALAQTDESAAHALWQRVSAKRSRVA